MHTSSVIFPPKKPLFQQKPNPANIRSLILFQGELAYLVSTSRSPQRSKRCCYKNCNKPEEFAPSALKHSSPYIYLPAVAFGRHSP